jgi:hypothetical protein
MAEHDRKLGRWDLLVAEVEVGPTHRARLDCEEDLTRPGFGVAQRPLPQRLTGALEQDRSH